MKVINTFQSYLNFFFIFGQSTRIQCKKPVSCPKLKRFIELIPANFVFLFHMYASYDEIEHHYDIHYKFYEKTSSAVFYIAILVAVFAHFSVIFQIMLHAQQCYRIWQSFEQVINYLKCRLGIKITFDKFKKKYLRKVLLIISIYLTSFAVKGFLNHISTEKWSSHTFLMFIHMFFMPFIKIHVIFYIDLINWFFQTTIDFISAEIRKASINYCESYGIVENVEKYIDILRHCKYLHFKQWKALKLINLYFGWIFIVICLVDFLQILYALIWFFLCTQAITYINILRKNIFIFAFFVLFFLLVSFYYRWKQERNFYFFIFSQQ